MTDSRRSAAARLDPLVRSIAEAGKLRRAFSSIAIMVWLCIMLGAGMSARGEGSPTSDEIDRWAFSGGVEAGVYGTTAEAEASGTLLVGPRATNLNFLSDDVATVISDVDGEADVLSGLVGSTFEVMSPAPFDVATHPRLFLDVSLLGALTQETSVARNGDPGEFAIREPVARAAGFVGERLVAGTGTDISSQPQGLQLHIGLGTAFTFDLAGSRIRIKPSVQYSRTENKVSVVANRAVRIVDQDPLSPIPGVGRIRSLDSYRLISLNDDFTEVYHGLGPALEVELDTDEYVGPFGVTVFLKGAASHLFGDLETKFLISNPEYPAEQVRFRYKNDAWAYQVTTGLRFRLGTGSK